MVKLEKKVGVLSISLFFILILAVLMSAHPAKAFDKSKAVNLEIGKKITEKATQTGMDEGYSKLFKFKTSNETGLYSLTLSNADFDPGFAVEIFDSNEVKVDNFYCYNIHERSNTNLKLNRNAVYYVEVKPYDSEKSGTGTYSLLLEEIKDEEPDDYKTAKTVTMNKNVKGEINMSWEEDWFKFVAPKKGFYYIKFNDKNSRISVYDDDVVLMDANYYSKRTNGFYKLPLEKDQLIYIMSTSAYAKENGYWFIIRNADIAKPLKAKLKSVKAGKNRLTVKLKKAKYAKKYQVAVKKKGAKKWKNYTSKKLVYTVKKLAKGKKYSVRVRGVNVIDKDVYYGPWSKTKTVRVK